MGEWRGRVCFQIFFFRVSPTRLIVLGLAEKGREREEPAVFPAIYERMKGSSVAGMKMCYEISRSVVDAGNEMHL